jgi:hypothetical protein
VPSFGREAANAEGAEVTIAKTKMHDVFFMLPSFFGERADQDANKTKTLARSTPQEFDISQPLRATDLRVRASEIGPDLFRAACRMGLEGLVSKRRDRPYQAGRSRDWIKVKNQTDPAMMRVMEAFT